MARPRTPTSVMVARGAFNTHPERARPLEPVVTEPIGDPPARITGLALEAWREIVAGAPEGVLTSADRITVEVAATLLAEFRTDPGEMHGGKLTRLCSLLGAMGMTPSDRAKMSIAPPSAPQTNPFGELDS